ncbi:hypothetical protein FRC04_010599 [Tulasnella sp. 424]|nr:hypothetical protein FRC04_010599 [Tulasnella sp. 424]KAG8972335.1 hypothetical protein FRC05_010177 [Tulasnella sp. 425]
MAKSLKKTIRTVSNKSSSRPNTTKLPAEAKAQHAAKKNNLLGTRSNGGRSAPARTSKNTRNEEKREELNAEDNMSALYANFTAKSDESTVTAPDNVPVLPTREATERAVDEAADALAVFGTA